jgi:hypothetical protein
MDDERTLSWWVKQLGINAELVGGFFMYFSRFEYALKAAGFAKGTEKRAEPDWDSFADSLEGKLAAVRDEEFQDAVRYMSSQPPERQILVDKVIRWKDSTRDPTHSEEKWLLVGLVKTTRNNLFHGGKFPPEPARDNRLLRACLTVLRQAMKLSPDVEYMFFHELGA